MIYYLGVGLSVGGSALTWTALVLKTSLRVSNLVSTSGTFYLEIKVSSLKITLSLDDPTIGTNTCYPAIGT